MLARLPKQFDPNVLVGFDTADDAGVYQLSPELALVQTVDFFTPIVDDPYTFGQIAAANSLSDVYAMGGRPISALSIVGFPNTGRDVEILEKILQGGLAKMQEAGCTVIGGHSIGDEEIKFGYAVTGVINPQRVLKNVGARPGDRLILDQAPGHRGDRHGLEERRCGESGGGCGHPFHVHAQPRQHGDRPAVRCARRHRRHGLRLARPRAGNGGGQQGELRASTPRKLSFCRRRARSRKKAFFPAV